MFAVKVTTGHTLWQRSTANWSATGLTASGDVVVLTGDLIYLTGNDPGYEPRGVYALGAGSGSLLWHQEAPNTRWLDPVLLATGNIVLIPPDRTGGTSTGGYRAVDATTGAALWSTTPSCPPSLNPDLLATEQTLYMTCIPYGGEATTVDHSNARPDSSTAAWSIVAINLTDGTTEWTAPEGTRLPGAGLLNVTTTVLIVGGGLTVAVIDSATGALLWLGNGRYLGTETSLMFFLQQTKPLGQLNPDAGKVLDLDTGTTLGTFAFAGGWTPPANFLFRSEGNAEAIVHTATGPVMTAVRLPTSGWTPPSVALVATPDGHGYWLAGQDGGVFAFGDAQFAGSLPALGIPVDDIVGMATTPDGGGYWLVGQDGGVFAFGDAQFYGSAAPFNPQSPIIGIAATPDGKGYWLVGSDGGVFAFGDAQFYGSIRTTPPVYGQMVGLSPTPNGKGYWLAVAPSMVPFGDAPAFMNGPANAVPVPQMATTPNGGGYWFIGQDGGVFSAGDAQFYGSVPGLGLRISDAIDITPTPDGGGYWVLGTDGGVFAFGDAGFYGSRG